MDDRIGAFKSILYALAAGSRLWTAVSGRRLAARAAGEDFGRGAAAGAALRELAEMGVKAAGALPLLAGVGAALVLLVGVAQSARALDDYVAGRKRIAELTATVRNLDRRYKAVEARIDEAGQGRIKARLAFFGTKDPATPI